MVRSFVILACLLLAGGSIVGQTASNDFVQANPQRVLQFPRDHGKHPDFQTEWWYFTGNLTSPEKDFGFQLTFFRRSLTTQPIKLDSKWTVRDLYPAHFALTDKTEKQFFHFDIISREGPDLAGAAIDDLDVRVRNWTVKRQNNHILLSAEQGDIAVRLTLNALKPLVLHGKNGYSVKGENENQASHYYSYTRLAANGMVNLSGKTYPVQGLAWMDHEFGSSILTSDQEGWDWFSLQLDDGTDLMVFHLRKKGGGYEKPFGTLVRPDGSAIYLTGRDIEILPRGKWKSQVTDASYPAEWVISLKETDTMLEVKPAVSDQELATKSSTQVIYWEGAVHITGRHEGKQVKGYGYAELTGYAHSMGGRL